MRVREQKKTKKIWLCVAATWAIDFLENAENENWSSQLREEKIKKIIIEKKEKKSKRNKLNEKEIKVVEAVTIEHQRSIWAEQNRDSKANGAE